MASQVLANLDGGGGGHKMFRGSLTWDLEFLAILKGGAKSFTLS